MTDAYKSKWGAEDIKIPVQEMDAMQAHVKNFLSCMRTCKKPTLHVETGAKAQVLISAWP